MTAVWVLGQIRCAEYAVNILLNTTTDCEWKHSDPYYTPKMLKLNSEDKLFYHFAMI